MAAPYFLGPTISKRYTTLRDATRLIQSQPSIYGLSAWDVNSFGGSTDGACGWQKVSTQPTLEDQKF